MNVEKLMKEIKKREYFIFDVIAPGIVDQKISNSQEIYGSLPKNSSSLRAILYERKNIK